KLMAWHRSNEPSRRLARIPGVGPVIASLLAMKTPNPHTFRSGRQKEASRGLARIPGVGPVLASLLAMKTPNPHTSRSGRQYAAWIGLTPKDHSTAGKTRHGVITRAGDETLRSLLVVGATAVIWQTRRGK